MLGSIRRREEMIQAKKLVRSLLESYWTSEIMEEIGSSHKHCKPVFVQSLYWFPIFIKAPAEKDKGWKVTSTVVSGEDILDVAKLIYKVFKAGGRLEAEIKTSPICQRESVVENVVVKPEDAAVAEFILKFEILDLASEA